MKRPNSSNRTMTILGLIIAALIVVSCASTRESQAPTTPPPSGTQSGTGDVFEEIVVAAQKSSRRASRARPQVMAFAAGGYSAAEPTAFPAIAALSPDEELWIIATPAGGQAESRDDQSPGSGAMVAKIDGQTDVPLPLEHTAVNARIDGYMSSVNVQQSFSNPFDTKIEAVYMFPLPEKAAVSEFLMIIGERKIRGILREKEEAEAIYREARSQGYQASLLVQHRPNIFEQKVANIEPGKQIDVDIRYFNTLAYNDGWYSFVFPTVVGPRYNPPGSSDPIVPVPRGTQPSPAGTTSVPYLRPDERSAHDISIEVEIDAGVAIEEIRSTHEILASRASPERASVKLGGGATIPNHDFVLDFQVAGKTVKSNLMTHVDPQSGQGYFTLMLYPPSNHESLARRPMEMVFVLDCSGSMRGRPLDQAKNAVRSALDQLQEGDTFQIIRFSENSTQLGARPLPATRENIRLARRYLSSLSGTGGTQMIEGIKAALDFPHDPSRLRFVSFMTDGYIGNEVDIIGAVHERIGASRIFSFGVGSSVNRYLLERMAKEGRGAVAYLGPRDSARKIMSSFFDRISHPAMTDIGINWEGMAVSDVYPAKLPDMFVGRPVAVTGKFLGPISDVSVSGMSGTQAHNVSIAADYSQQPKPAIAKIWARLRIADLADRQTWEHDPHGELANAIKGTALEHQLVSDYTSFVAVDTSRRTEGDHGVTVPQAVPVPDGVRYDTTVERQ